MRKYAIAIIFLLAIPQAFAALQITAFSCNGETGTINIPNNNPFTCTATINNPDDSTASLNSVKLYIDGDWTAQSHSGSGFSTSISTGASATATFIDITPTTTGSHKFSYILLDGVSDTFVADSTVNVMNIRIAKATANLTTAKQTNEFTVIAEIPTSGAMSVTASIDVSDCTLATGEETTKSLGLLTEGAQTSISWRLVMGAGDCSYTVSVTGSGSGKVTDSLSGSISNLAGAGSSGSTSSSGGGGGGGGGGGAALESESSLLSSIPAGGVGTFTFKKFANLSIHEISFSSTINVENPKITVKEATLGEGVTVPEGSVYKYLSIMKEGVISSEMMNITIRFKVPNKWLAEKSVHKENVSLARYSNGKWVQKKTKLLGNEGDYAVYEAYTENLSIFAITGKRASSPTGRIIEEKPAEETPVIETEKLEQKTAEQAEENRGEETAAAPEPRIIMPKDVIWTISWIIAVIGTLLVIVLASHHLIRISSKHIKEASEEEKPKDK